MATHKINRRGTGSDAGPQKSIYKRYGVKKENKNMTDIKSYEMSLKLAKQKSSNEAFSQLNYIIKEYERVFGLWF